MTHRFRTRGRPLVAAGVAMSAAALAAGLMVAPSGASLKPASTRGVTKHQIILGTTTPLSGPAAPGYDEIAPAANAVFRYVNAHGGIYGRKIKYIIENDEYDPPLTVSLTNKLVESDHIFADVGPLGTPTQLAVQGFLNKHKVPQVFIESGCACWSQPKKYPYSFGWQPNYIVEGKILGSYIKAHYGSKKVGYLYQDDEFGKDGVRGLDKEISKSHIVSQQTYQGTAQGLAAGLGNQIGALKAAHAKVVVLYTIPAATALALLAAAELNYHPQWVVSSVGADPPTLTGLLGAFSKGAAGGALLNGMVTNAYLPPETDGSNPWNKLAKKIIAKYDSSKAWDGNSEYGIALGISTVEALEAAGKNLTVKGFVTALEKQGKNLSNPGLVPLTYSTKSHYGFSGSEVVKILNSGKKISVLSPKYVTTKSGPIRVYKGKSNQVPAQFKK
jgi:branched-chain amino acid transport system substrate-binding protein